MQFRKAYFDSMDAQLTELDKQLDEMADMARSFTHLSAIPIAPKTKAKAERTRPKAWPIDRRISAVSPWTIAIAGP